MAAANNQEDFLTLIKCAKSKPQNWHICQEPMLLSCGHYVCKSCSKDGLSYMKCNICNKQTDQPPFTNSINPTTNKLFDYVLNEKLSDVFNILCDEFDKKIDYCNNIESKCRETFDLKVEFIKSEIELSIESIKIALDKFKQSFYDKIDNYSKDVEISLNENDSIKPNMDILAKDLKNMKNDVEIKQNMTKESLYAYQKNIIKLNEFISQFEATIPSIKFHQPSKISFSIDIGDLVYSYPDNEYIDMKLTSRIKENKYKNVIIPNKYICNMCVLPDGNLLACDSTNRVLFVVSPNMEIIETINTIGNNKYNIICLDTNKIDCIYMSSCEQNCILKTDLAFNLIVEYKSYGAKQLNIPCGVCYSEEKVYVCDNGNKRIAKFDDDLEYECAFPVNYHPWYIKIVKNTACVRDNLSAIHFHDVKSFQQLQVYDGHNGVIGASNKYFYEYFHKNETIYCFNENGDQVNQIKTKGYRFDLNNGSLCLYNKHLFICSRSSYLVKI